MNIHFCWFDKTCRDEGAPKRLYISVFNWNFYIGWREISLWHKN